VLTNSDRIACVDIDHCLDEAVAVATCPYVCSPIVGEPSSLQLFIQRSCSYRIVQTRYHLSIADNGCQDEDWSTLRKHRDRRCWQREDCSR
jgi:hypothetical protein